MLYLLDYGAGNVRSLANSITHLGFQFKWVSSPDDFQSATRLIFPGVGAFGPALEALRERGFDQPLIDYIKSGKPYMGICIGMQALFLSSEESPQVPGLGIVPAHVVKFSSSTKSVPHMGWNTAVELSSALSSETHPLTTSESKSEDSAFYFVHSYRASHLEAMNGWTQTLTRYEDEVFVSSIRRQNIFATQFHPEKSGPAGLELLRSWLSEPEQVIRSYSDPAIDDLVPRPLDLEGALLSNRSGLMKRIIACLDVRSNDSGDLVVTKGDQYDVREPGRSDDDKSMTKGDVRNLGKPVDLARRYYQEGADEITFLNITSFRACPLDDQPMLQVLQQAAETVFVPFCVGGGIKETVEPDGSTRSALEVATAYFRAGADKVSIGGDAVLAVESYLKTNPEELPKTGISEIARVYGRQAVVVSIDPKRVYVSDPLDAPSEHRACVVDLASTSLEGSQCGLEADLGPKGERYCWYQCTVKGGRESRGVDVVQMARGAEAFGAGEILLNSVDKDGGRSGFDLRLVQLVKRHVSIPVIASSGAGAPHHFSLLFQATNVQAGLAAGIFHRNIVPLHAVKSHLRTHQIPVRRTF